MRSSWTESLTILSMLGSLAIGGCGLFGKKASGSDAGAAAAPGSVAAPVTPSAPPPAAKSKTDATDCNPGTSLNPIDKGKTVQSDHFKYTLLDVRTDTVDNAFAKVKKVYLLKLQVENITQKPQLNTSVADVELTRDKAAPDRHKEKDLAYKIDFFYSRSKICVDIGGDIKPGMIPPGAKVVGYYVYGDPGTPEPKSLWFSALNVTLEGKGGFQKATGSLRIK